MVLLIFCYITWMSSEFKISFQATADSPPLVKGYSQVAQSVALIYQHAFSYQLLAWNAVCFGRNSNPPVFEMEQRA